MPIDYVGTVLKLPHTARITVFETELRLNSESKTPPESSAKTLKELFSLVLKKAFSREMAKAGINVLKTYVVEAEVNEENWGEYAAISCSPRFLESDLLDAVDSGTVLTLSSDLVILPDFSTFGTEHEQNIMTTSDFFHIRIEKGSNVLFREGGTSGNVMIEVREGTMKFACSGVIEVNAVRANF